MNQHKTPIAGTGFDAYDVGVEIVRKVGPVVGAIVRRDADLGGQVRRAAPSIPLNIAEGWRRLGKDRRYHYAVAAGSASELRTALHIAEAWGYVRRAEIAELLPLLDRELAMLYRLTH